MVDTMDIQSLLKEKIVVFDGAMGTSIQNLHLTPEDFGGAHLEGCNEALVLTKPDAIQDIHAGFLDAGADVIETNSFGATSIVLSEYGLADKSREINRAAARLAGSAAEKYHSSTKPRLVAGSMGPTTRSISVTGGVTFEQLIQAYREQAAGLIEGGVDLLLLETCQDTRNVKAAILGIRQAEEQLAQKIPLMVSGTIEPMGTMLAGQSVEALYTSLEHTGLLSIGLNCATGPQFMTDHIRSLSGIANCFISCMPNAGLPDEEGRYNETPESLVEALARFAGEGWVNILGGCCGTTPEHIERIARMAEDYRPREPRVPVRCHVSGIDYLEITDDKRPVMIGERTNVIGSRRFKRLIAEGQFDEASEIARRQVRSGADIIDVCLADPDRDEMADMQQLLGRLIQKVKAPVMIDSTDPAVIEKALEYCQGKSIINSINLEDGEERFQKVVPLAHRFGAAFIVGCIDDDPDQGMAITVERKLEVARKSFDLLTGKYGVPPQDIIFDALVFPCATGDANYTGSAAATIEGVAAIKKEFPQCKTILGVSNVSFGLPAAGREVLNSVFLYHCTRAGLDLAIVNTEKLQRYPTIAEEERQLAENILFNRGDDPIAAFAEFYKEKKPVDNRPPRHERPLEERLSSAIVEAIRENLTEDIDEALQSMKPLEIINGPLMNGMDEVGRLFGNNELIVAEVLQSAEVMKAAVAYLEPYMEKEDSAAKGSIILATVKGDVHDIGKNLVDIILSNNGFRVINLGIKAAPEKIIEAVKKENPDLIGLSGLLVKSAQQMVATAEDLASAGIHIPVLVGGAALSNRFTRLKIAPVYGDTPVAYARDAMQGLDLANKLLDPAQRLQMTEDLRGESTALLEAAESKKDKPKLARAAGQTRISQDVEPPAPPDFRLHIIDKYPLEEIFPWINRHTLLGKHLGLKGAIDRLIEKGDSKATGLWNSVVEFQNEIIAHEMLRPRAVYQFFPARPVGDEIEILPADRAAVQERFHFPRQSSGSGLCLSDFLLQEKPDNLAAFVTTAADENMMEWSSRFKREGQLLKSHMLQAIALETAEAFAELLHRKIREMWGFADPEDMTMRDLFKAKYRGLRVSFGYPACPRLEDQVQLFRMLKVEESIGVLLTEGFMMEPEASVSALVFHHPDARYFNIPLEDQEAFDLRLRKQGGGRL